MKGILILAHGSREKSTEQTLQAVVEQLKEINQKDIIETAYLQFAEIDLASGLDALQAKGVKEIVVIPYFLFAGVHIKEDIPQEIKDYQEKNKDVRIIMGETLGADRRLAEILADRINAAR